TSVVVFLPLIFMGSNATLRIMLGALGIPLCTSLLFSLLVALVFLPVSTSRILGGRPAVAESVGRWMTPLVDAPVRALAHGIGALRYLAHGFTRALFAINRLALRILTPLRWVLAVGLIALAAWRVQLVAPTLGAAKQGLSPFGIPTDSIQAAQGWLGFGAAFALLGAALAIFGLPRWRRRAPSSPLAPSAFTPAGTSVIAWLQSANRALLGWTLNHRPFAAFLALIAFASVVIPISNMQIAAFGQEEDTTSLDVRVSLEDNFTFAEASKEMAAYEEFLEDYREEFGFEHMISRFNPGGGEVGLRWSDQQDPEYLNDIRAKLRRTLPKFPGHHVRLSSEQQLGSTSKQYVWFQLRGTNAEALESYGQQAIELLEAVPGLTDVSSALESAPEQVRLEIDAEAAHSYGVTADATLRNVSWVLRGANLPRFHEEGREVPLIMEYDTERLAGLDTLRDLQIFNGEAIVPLSAFTELSFTRGQRNIRRTNGKTTFNIQARLSDPNRQLELVDTGYAALDALDMPRGFSLGRDDSALAKQQQETGEMQSAVTLSIVLVFLLMAILFESLLLPISVLTTIPFAVLGAMWTMFLTGTVMDSVGWIGIIILVGLVVNNGIVLIDKIHRLRLSGVERSKAVLDGASARVRPILMTALTTIFGLMPMALGEAVRQGIDYRALATCVAGGLTISTFFTLWVVPLAYTLADDLAHSLSWVGKRTVQWGQSKPSTEFALNYGSQKAAQDTLAGAGAARGPMDKA
ncbi:MAG: multidrug efflux pump subunit AcrB, partial [Planctomycetota bacterium]